MIRQSVEARLGVCGYNRWPPGVKRSRTTMTQGVQRRALTTRVNVELVAELHGFHQPCGVPHLVISMDAIEHQQRIHNKSVLMMAEVFRDPFRTISQILHSEVSEQDSRALLAGLQSLYIINQLGENGAHALCSVKRVVVRVIPCLFRRHSDGVLSSTLVLLRFSSPILSCDVVHEVVRGEFG